MLDYSADKKKLKLFTVLLPSIIDGANPLILSSTGAGLPTKHALHPAVGRQSQRPLQVRANFLFPLSSRLCSCTSTGK